jgi:hypothetical protein
VVRVSIDTPTTDATGVTAGRRPGVGARNGAGAGVCVGIAVLGVFGGPVMLLTLATALYAARAARLGNGAVAALSVGLVSTMVAFFCWGFVWIASSGC